VTAHTHLHVRACLKDLTGQGRRELMNWDRVAGKRLEVHMNKSRWLPVRLVGIVACCAAGAYGGLASVPQAADKALVGAAFVGACCAIAVVVGSAVARLFRPGAGRE
jgi:hypothetical protein